MKLKKKEEEVRGSIDLLIITTQTNKKNVINRDRERNRIYSGN